MTGQSSTLPYARYVADVRLSDRILLWLDRNRRAVFVGVVVLYVIAFNGQWRVNRDSALYAAVGAAVARGEGYTYQGEPHRWVEPGLPLMIAASFRAFGPNVLWPVHVALLATGLAALALAYRLFTTVAGRPTGVLMLLALAICETVFRYPYFLFTDTPFLLGVVGFLLAHESVDRPGGPRPLAWAALGAATFWALAFRPVGIVLVGAALLASAWHVVRRERAWRHVAVAGLLVACVLTFRLVDPRRATAGGASVPEQMAGSIFKDPVAMVRRTVTQLVPQLLEETVPEAFFGTRIGPGVSSVATLAIISCGLALGRRRPLWGIYVASSVAQMVLFLPRERYFVPLLPLLIYGAWTGLREVERRVRPPWGERALLVGVLLFAVPNAVLVGRFVVQQRRTPFLDHFDKGHTKDLVAMGRALPAFVGENDLVLSDAESRILHYFSGRHTVEPPDPARFSMPEAVRLAYEARLANAPRLYVVLPIKPPKVDASRAMLDREGWAIGPELTRTTEWTLHEVVRPVTTTRPSPE